MYDRTMEDTLKAMVANAIGMQRTRIQTGNRVCAMFRKAEGLEPGEPEESDEEVAGLMDELRQRCKRITDAVVERQMAGKKITKRAAEVQIVADNLTAAVGKSGVVDAVEDVGRLLALKSATAKVTADNFIGDEVVDTFAKFALIDQYCMLLAAEEQAKRSCTPIMASHPMWDAFFRDIKGIGTWTASAIISQIDMTKCKYASSVWKYAGLDVGPDNRARSRRKEHLVEREYIDSDGNTATRMGITYQPDLKRMLLGVVGDCMLKQRTPKYRDIYDNYKHRMENHDVYGVHNDGKAIEGVGNISKGRRHRQAIRYMVKMLLLDMFNRWREVLDLPPTEPYHEAKLGMKHGEMVEVAQ